MIRCMIAGVVSVWFCGACTTTPATLFENLGEYHRPVTTKSKLAQRYFDQGLILTYGFNADEALRSFKEAVRIDPDLAMGWWGVAFALGPNLSHATPVYHKQPPLDTNIARQAHTAIQKALSSSKDSPPVERALIQALVLRYPDPSPRDGRKPDKAYASAMRKVWQKYPNDPDVGVLFAEAMLKVSPWYQWTNDGKPRPGTEEVVETLERVLATHPAHAGANHLYIHVVEGSSAPERALPAADRLTGLVPNSGHLVHMPSHIYIQTGDYDKAMAVNKRSVDIDRRYVARVGPQQLYELYRTHTYHFLAYAAMFAGNKATALQAGRDLVADLPPDVLRDMPDYAEGFYAVLWHAMIRFGLWEDILNEPEPDTPLTIAPALWHYARGVAFANTGRLDRAVTETAAFETLAAQVKDDTYVGFTPAPLVMDVARHMLRGEILFRQGNRDGAFAALRRGVELEEALPYDEPRGWMQPVSHALGALLLEADRVAEAEEIYRADLKVNPENSWSLHGLAECLRRRGDVASAKAVEVRFKKAWTQADTKIQASCFCRSKK